VGLILLIWLGVFAVSCHETDRHRILTFFFDGVGPLRPAGIEEVRIDPNFAQSPQEPLWYVHEPRKDCTLCHGKRGQKLFAPEAILIALVPALCHNCHDDYTVSAQFVHGPVAVGQCLFCHNPHKSRIQYLLKEPEPKLCYKCHDINVIESMPAHLTVQPSACTDCHNPHASPTKALLKKDRPQLSQNSDRVRAAMQDYVQRAKSQNENALLERAETTQTESDSLFQIFLTASKLIEQGQLQEAKVYLEGFKNNNAFTDSQREKIAEVLALMDKVAAKAGQGPERVDQAPVAKSEKDNEQLSKQKREVADLYYRSMELYREGKLASARKGFVAVLKSGLIPPPMGETIRGYLSDIDNRLARGATQQ
jgi:predicted CXXCH cytochrome family protein